MHEEGVQEEKELEIGLYEIRLGFLIGVFISLCIAFYFTFKTLIGVFF